MDTSEIENFRTNKNFILWMTTVNHCPEAKIRSLTTEDYLGGWCEDWAVYFAVRYDVPVRFLNEQHNLVQIDDKYYDAANSDGVSRLSDLEFVKNPANRLSDKTEEELQAMLKIDTDWEKYPALSHYVHLIEKKGETKKEPEMDNLKMAKELVRLAKSLVAMPVDDWNGSVNDFDNWYHKAIGTLFGEVNAKLATYKMPFDYAIEYDESYETCRDELMEDDDPVYRSAIGVAMFSNQADANVLPIAVDNEKLISIYFDTSKTARVKSELETTIWHEVAHGLLERFKDEFAAAGTEDTEFNCFINGNVEQTCEDFGKASGNLETSAFGKWIKKNSESGWTNIYGENEDE